MALDLVSWGGLSIYGALYNCCCRSVTWIKHRSAHSRGCVPELAFGVMDASVCLLAAGLGSCFTAARSTHTDAACSYGQGLGVPMAAATDHIGFSSKVLVVLSVGLSSGIFSPLQYSIFVLVTAVTTLMSTPLCRIVQRRL